ncbi:hypothetical protein GJ496_003615 [Pomphorhynchus laevis]|nr:hypothetical protein GJ496_003615 [Pomphorhynchus laevis]
MIIIFPLVVDEEQGLVVQPIVPAAESCVAVSFASAPADITNAVNTVAAYCTTEKLVIFEHDFDVTLFRVLWAAANGLPRFVTPAVDPPRVCLLNGLIVPHDSVCFVRIRLPIVPAVGPMTAQQVLRDIAILTGIRNEHRFSLAGYYRACIYYNLWRPVDNRGNAQYFASTMEWRVATWHTQRYTNSLLVYLNRICLPHHVWAETELRSDLVCVYRDVDRFEYGKNAGIIQQLTNRANGELMPAISTTAAVIRKQMGLPSLGGDVFCVYDDTALGVVWSRLIPYVIDPITVLWMCSEYSALWHIPRSPVTYRIMKELYKPGRGGEPRFIPALGDNRNL